MFEEALWLTFVILLLQLWGPFELEQAFLMLNFTTPLASYGLIKSGWWP